jgi:hypothetical protein
MVYVVKPSCPIECLAPFVEGLSFAALAGGMSGQKATVGQVIELYEQGCLTDIRNVGPARVGEIRQGLIAARLVDPSSKHGGKRPQPPDVTARTGHHESCGEYRGEG